MSGGNLHDIWALPMEYQIVDLFWEMASHHCFRIERYSYQADPLHMLVPGHRGAGRIAVVFYVEVSSDLVSKPFPVQSRDYNAMAACNTVCTNVGKDLRLGPATTPTSSPCPAAT